MIFFFFFYPLLHSPSPSYSVHLHTGCHHDALRWVFTTVLKLQPHTQLALPDFGLISTHLPHVFFQVLAARSVELAEPE